MTHQLSRRAPRSRRMRALAGLAGLSMLVGAACGGDDGDADAPAPTTTTAPDDTTGGDTPDTSDGSDGAPATEPSPSSSVASGEQDDEPAGDRCEATVPDTEVTFASYALSGKLDPVQVAGGLIGGTEAAAIYDVLFTYDDETGEVVPHLAESITANDDYTTFTLTLRPDITFADGTALDAGVVAANLERFNAEGATAPHRAFVALIESTTVIDPLTLELTMTRPWAEFPAFLTEQMGMIVNPNAVGDDLAAFAAEPPPEAGVGPYVLERNAPGEEVVLVARDDYWGGPVCIERLRFVPNPGGQPALDAFEQGEFQVAFFRDAALIDQLENAEDIQTMFSDVQLGRMLQLNLADGNVGADARLREAIWLAIDPEVENERIFDGKAHTIGSLLSPELFPNTDIAQVEPDPERAAQLIAEAQADGVDTSITLLTTNLPPAPDVMLSWQAQLERAGFDVTIESNTQNEQILQVFQGSYEATTWALSISPAQLTTRLYAALATGAANNRMAYANPEMDAALEAAMGAGPAEREAALAEVNDIYVGDFATPVFSTSREGIAIDGVDGIVELPTYIYLFGDAAVTG